MVDEPVGDAGLVGDVRHAAGVEALAGEHAHRRVEDLPALVRLRAGAGRSSRGRSALTPRCSCGPAVGLRAAVGERRAAVARISCWRSRSSSASDVALAVGRLRQHDAPRVHDHRAPARVLAGGVGADLVGGDHEGLVLDRPRPQQHLPVVAGGREREGGRDGDHARAPHGEDPVQLGEAQVVADRQPQPTPSAVSRQHDLLAGLLELGLAVDAPADLDVEHVELAVDAPGPPPRRRRAREVLASFSSPSRRSRIEPATSSTPSSRASRAGPRRSPGRRAARRPRAAPRSEPIAVHFSGSTISSAPSAAAARVRRSAVARFAARSAVELSCTAATLKAHLLPFARRRPSVRLTGQSTARG